MKTFNKIQQHWESVYKTKDIAKASWHQDQKSLSFELILKYSNHHAKVMDCGSGTADLVDNLLNAKYHNITLLDISSEALSVVKNRIFDNNVTFITSSVLDFNGANFDIWHDRAVLHFLTNKLEYKKYFEILNASIASGGVAIIATFVTDKVRKCSDLTTKAYDNKIMLDLIGTNWQLLESLQENHQTPNGDKQLFNYFCLQKIK